MEDFWSLLCCPAPLQQQQQDRSQRPQASEHKALTFKGVHENWLVLLPFGNSQPASLFVIIIFILYSGSI